MEETLNIYQKLAKIRRLVEVMKKDTRAYNYNYVKEEDILAKITTGMEKYNLSLIPGIVPGSTQVAPYSYIKTKVLKTGEVIEEHVNEILVSADTTWMWVNNDNPSEYIIVPWAMVGQQEDASQSFGSGLTYSSRYFLLKYFNISTSNDDPDAWRGKQREAEVESDKMIAQEITETVGGYIQSFLGDFPDRRDDVLKLVKKYVKSGDYRTITDPALAARLLSDFEETFMPAKETEEAE